MNLAHPGHSDLMKTKEEWKEARTERKFFTKTGFQGPPSGLVVRTLSFQCREYGFKPWSWNLDSADPTCHVAWQKKKTTTTTKRKKTGFHSWNFISPINVAFFFQSTQLFHREAYLVPNPNQQQHLKQKKHRRPKFRVNDICSQRVT